MNRTTSHYPDGITAQAVTSILDELSDEIASPFAPTTAYVDGSAVARRNARMLARAAAGISPKHGISLAQAAQEAATPVRPVPVATTSTTAQIKKLKSARHDDARAVHHGTGTEAA